MLPGNFQDQNLITFHYNKLSWKIMGKFSHKSRIDLPGLAYAPLEYLPKAAISAHHKANCAPQFMVALFSVDK